MSNAQELPDALPATKRRAKSPKADAPAALSRFQKFAMVEVHRSQLKGAAYNPRRISDEAKKRLRANIKRVGLIDPVIWNVRTGNLVGGHQRLAALDALEGTGNYRLTVCQVDLDEKTEREQNVFLNNPQSQGEWDTVLLEKLFKETGADYELASFDSAEVIQMFGESVLNEKPEKLTEMAEKLRGYHERLEKQAQQINDRDDQDFYTVVVFRNHADRKAFTDALGLEDNRYVDGKFLTAKLGGHGEGPDLAEEYLEEVENG